MANEYSLVEVLMIQYQPGDKEYQSFFENEVHCFDGNWQDSTVERTEVMLAMEQSEKNRLKAQSEGRNSWSSSMLASEPELLITQPLTAFQFKYMGQDLDREYSSGIEWEVCSMDADYIFKDWLEDLKELGNSILADKKEMGHPKAKNIVRFVTLWSYSSYVDTYNQEFDSEWYLLGLVDLKQVALTLKEKK